jgi:hypothetical protein
MIKPTVGRVVLYWPSAVQAGTDTLQPFAATVAYVWNDRMVNLSVTDHNGKQFGVTSVRLLQDGDERPNGRHVLRVDALPEGPSRQDGSAGKAKLAA